MRRSQKPHFRITTLRAAAPSRWGRTRGKTRLRRRTQQYQASSRTQSAQHWLQEFPLVNSEVSRVWRTRRPSARWWSSASPPTTTTDGLTLARWPISWRLVMVVVVVVVIMVVHGQGEDAYNHENVFFLKMKRKYLEPRMIFWYRNATRWLPMRCSTPELWGLPTISSPSSGEHILTQAGSRLNCAPQDQGPLDQGNELHRQEHDGVCCSRGGDHRHLAHHSGNLLLQVFGVLFDRRLFVIEGSERNDR